MGDRTKVLVVDDLRMNLMLMATVLQPLGLDVLCASSGPEALALARDHDLALVLLDVMMPGMDGFTTAEALRELERSRNMPIIFVTAIQQDQAHVFKGYEMGAVDYLFKPIDPEIVKSKVRVFVSLYEQKRDLERLTLGLERTVAELTRSRAELRESEEMMRALLQATADTVILLDQEGRVLKTNGRAATALGREEGLLPGRDILEFFPLEEHHRLRSLCQTVLAAGTPASFVGRRGQGWLDTIIYPVFDAGGRVGRLAVYSRDITNRRLVEEAEKKRQTAEAANRAKSDFLAMMSHEIRTPLNAIIGMGDLLTESALSPDQAKYVGILTAAGENLLGLINDILDISKVESGRLELEEIAFDLHRLVDRTVLMMAPRSHQKGVEIFSRIDPATPRTVTGDPTRLRQILANLIGNAVKFTVQGEIVATVRPLDRKVLPETGGTVQEFAFSVRDTGIGIPANRQADIFESFTQADTSTTRRYGGSGLGLSIVKRLVELMGGGIQVESREGEGSTFSFTVRLRLPEEAAPAPDPGRPLAGLRVLVADDNATQRLIVREALEPLGATVSEAREAHQALAMARDAREAGGSFDVVLLDWRMPGIGGRDLAERLVRSPDMSGQVFVLLTTDHRAGDLERVQSLGAAGYFLKPVPVEDLTERLSALASRTGKPDAHSPPAPRPLARPLRILAAEDSENNRLLLSFYLQNTPHVLDFAENGRQALERVQAEAFDLVLMDMHMPEMDGYMATAAIREHETARGLPPVPIVALTAGALSEDQKRCMVAGCTRYLVKPVRKAVLLALLDGIASGETPTCPVQDNTPS